MFPQRQDAETAPPAALRFDCTHLQDKGLAGFFSGSTAAGNILKVAVIRPLPTRAKPVRRITPGPARPPLRHVRPIRHAGRSSYLGVNLTTDSGNDKDCSGSYPT